VLANFQQTAIAHNTTSAQPLEEPIAFERLPDGRILQTSRRGTVRLHDPVAGTVQTIADMASPSVPQTMRIYNNSEDGLYGPGIDNNFAQNHWVYLYYAPQTVTNVKLSTGQIVTQTTPNDVVPNFAPSATAWDPYVGYFQLSRFKFVEDANGPRLDLNSEQQILRVSNNRQECCHVAGDIEFDTHNNLWIVTGDDTPAGGIRANGYGPFEDELTDEQQTVQVAGATGGTFTLTFNGQTTAPIAYDATGADIDAALEALSNVGTNNIQTSVGPVNTAVVNVFFRRALGQKDQNQITANGASLTGNSPTVTAATPVIANGTMNNGTVNRTTPTHGGQFQRPTGDDRRSTLNTNDLRGKILRIKVKDAVAVADQNKADLGTGGAYTIPAGNLFPLQNGQPQARTRPEIYAMGFRNPFRLHVDENDVAYVTDYSPDAQTPQRGRGPAGVGRAEIVRHPGNYGYPLCYSRTVGYYAWGFQEFAPGSTTVGVPLDAAGRPTTTDSTTNPPQRIDCSASNIVNDSRWVLNGGPGNEPGLRLTPALTDPDIWYSYRDNNATTPLGTPCPAYYDPTPGPTAPGSTTECPRLFPELFTGGVGPHDLLPYRYNSANPNPTKFPPYYDGKLVMGEFAQNTMRLISLDSANRIQKINPFLNCGPLTRNPALLPFECNSPMDMQFGSDGNLYTMTYGTGFFTINPASGLFRFSYVKGGRPPVAVASADKTDGPVPLTVRFSSAGSRTPDANESITYSWNFGDGTARSVEPNPTHTYTTAGVYTAILTVTDSSNRQSATSIRIVAGNTSPTVVINTPPEGGTFNFGDNIPFTVTVTDPEDGTIDCSRVSVTFVLGHDTHGHAEQSVNGCSGTLVTDPTDVFHGGNVFGVVNASYTDRGGAGGTPSLSTTTIRNIRQKHQEVENVATQSGTNTGGNTDGGLTPPGTNGVHRGSLAAGDWIQLPGPFNLTNINPTNSITFRVADAVAGRTAGTPLARIEVHQDSITGPVLVNADLNSTGSTTTWTSQSYNLTMSGTHEIFLVFREVVGGATGATLFNLNWVQFNGQGVGT